MAYTRWGAIGEQAGRGLQSGLDMALKEKMKQRQISDFAKKYDFDEEKIAGAMMGLPAVGGGASLQDQILYNALKSQFPNIQMPTKSIDPYDYYRKKVTQQQPQGQPSNNGVDQIIAADGNLPPRPYVPPKTTQSTQKMAIDPSWPKGTDEKGNVFYQAPDGKVYDSNGELVPI